MNRSIGVMHGERDEVDRNLSVIVCTHNRAPDVVECVMSLLAQEGARELELIIVDSASSPEHRDRLQSLAQACPSVTLIRLERAGLSLARNQGVAQARGRWLAFLDDDALPAPDWLAHALRIADNTSDDIGAVGGRILPRFPSSRPPHIGARWLMFLSCIEATSQPAERTRPECYGANLMFRRADLSDVGAFSTELGRAGNQLLSGEETLVFEALLARKKRVVYEGALTVEHKISAERLSRAWIRRRAYWGGITEVVMAHKTRARRPLHLHPAKVVLSLPLLAVLTAFNDPQSDRYIRLWYAMGVLRATLKPIEPAANSRFLSSASRALREARSASGVSRFARRFGRKHG